MPTNDRVRLLVVEDVPEVARFIRSQLAEQSAVELIDILSDGSRVVGEIKRDRPDVIVVDLLLRGRVKGHEVVEQIRRSGIPLSVIAMTVPQHPVRVSEELGVHGVLTMPFSGYELVGRVQQVERERRAGSGLGGTRGIAVFAPKGGVGKTTIALNLAAAIAPIAGPTLLVDASLQFGDLRTLLRVPPGVGSILDLPTDRILADDLEGVTWHDPSGIDVLLAPPRIEMAELVTSRDVLRVLSLLRRLYSTVVIDLSSVVNDVSLAFLDASTTVVEVVTPESTAIHNVQAMDETFAAIGYPPGKVRWLMNRAEASDGGSEIARSLGREPDYWVRSDGRLVVRCNNEGVPFVLAEPSAAISRDIGLIASQLVAYGAIPVGAGLA
jgi:pilus assembly protein CpaE